MKDIIIKIGQVNETMHMKERVLTRIQEEQNKISIVLDNIEASRDSSQKMQLFIQVKDNLISRMANEAQRFCPEHHEKKDHLQRHNLIQFESEKWQLAIKCLRTSVMQYYADEEHIMLLDKP